MNTFKTNYISCMIFFLSLLNQSTAWPFEVSTENDWNGNWFPHAEGVADTNEAIEYQYNRTELHDDAHGIKMGVPSNNCDDGKTLLQQDWLNDSVNYTCYDSKTFYLPREDVYPFYIAEHIPTHYSALHKCMDEPIFYDNDIPTFGTHRPLWARYGEYKFLPKQRWIHNLEHGAIVMLYHPCANALEVDILRKVVTNCLYRHVITPYNLLTPTRPLALVAWGRKLLLSKVDPQMVQNFIKMAAKRGPEKLSKDGQYDYELIREATVVTTPNDDVLCPNSFDPETIE